MICKYIILLHSISKCSLFCLFAVHFALNYIRSISWSPGKKKNHQTVLELHCSTGSTESQQLQSYAFVSCSYKKHRGRKHCGDVWSKGHWCWLVLLPKWGGSAGGKYGPETAQECLSQCSQSQADFTVDAPGPPHAPEEGKMPPVSISSTSRGHSVFSKNERQPGGGNTLVPRGREKE